MMDSVFTLIQYGLMGLAGFLVLGWLGFRIPARAKKPEISLLTNEISIRPVPDDLPAPISRYLNLLYPAGIPQTSSVTAWGKGKITSRLRAFGKVWLPLSWTLYLVPGKSYLWRVNITWFMRPFIRGGDQFMDGHGIYKMGSEVLESEFIDLSEFTILWVNTLVFAPFSLADLPGLIWKMVGDHSVRLTVPGYMNTWNDFHLDFDPVSGALRSIKTKRTASLDGEKLDFQTTVSSQIGISGYSFLPNFNSAWESVDYLHLVSNGLVLGTLVDPEIENGI